MALNGCRSSCTRLSILVMGRVVFKRESAWFEGVREETADDGAVITCCIDLRVLGLVSAADAKAKPETTDD